MPVFRVDKTRDYTVMSHHHLRNTELTLKAKGLLSLMPHLPFHALRHTFATRTLEAEIPAKVVQDVLGHADVTLTLNTYSHVMSSTAHDQMAKINRLFEGKGMAQKKKGRNDFER